MSPDILTVHYGFDSAARRWCCTACKRRAWTERDRQNPNAQLRAYLARQTTARARSGQ